MEKKIYLLKLKEIIMLSLVFSTLFISTVAFGQAPKNGLKLYYNFEGVTGTAIPDSSGNALNGTAIGAATVVTGYKNNGLNLPTASKPAVDYIKLPNGITGSLKDFTVAAWVNPTTVDWWQRIFDFGGGESNNMFLTTRGGSGDGNLRFAIKNGGGEDVIDGPVLSANVWTHVAVTCSYKDGIGTGILYVNGNQVGINKGISITPAMLDITLGTPTSQNYIGKSQYNDNGYVGAIDEFRIYNRALTSFEMLQTVGSYPAELLTQWQNLTWKSLTNDSVYAVKTNLNLPVTLGSQGVSVSWTSSSPANLATNGTVTRPPQGDVVDIKLTALLKIKINGKTDSLVKIFYPTVLALSSFGEIVAQWKFASPNISTVHDTLIKVMDESGNKLVGTLKDVARIRTIGKTVKYNVLDLGNNKGYFDMDTVIGKAVYSLKNYYVGAYFYIDSTYTELDNWGNCVWSFSNAASQGYGGSGVMFMSLKYQGNVITATGYSTESGPKINTNAPKGKWTHIGYTQKGDSGYLFVNGVKKMVVKVAATPLSALAKPGRTGTNYNTIGVPSYVGDNYLKKTLIYGFELYSVPMSEVDMEDVVGVSSTLAALNKAYKEAPDVPLPELIAERDNLSLGDLSAVTSNLTLPSKGTLDNAIYISWKSSNANALSNSGVVKSIDYLSSKVVLTASLSKNGQVVTKDFAVTIPAKSGTGFASDLLLNYNFATSQVSGTTVTDAAEKHFTGALKKGATVATIGPANNQHNILYLGKDSAYFDMGTECGKLLYGLNDYSVSLYFLIDKNKGNLDNDGNFLYTFSNSDSSGTVRNGYMFGRATNLIQCVSSSYWSTGNMATPGGGKPSLGTFHHFLYTQQGLVGTVYFDGKVVATNTSFTNLPSVALPKEGRTGTLYNFLGRSSYVGDKYLSKAILADFQLYKKALTRTDVDAMQVKTTNLNLAYINDSVPALLNEYKNLDLGNLTAVVSDLNLPVTGTLDPSVAISWQSNKTFVIKTNGVVTRPDFLDAKVVLIATLSKDGETLTKKFIATVKANPGTEYASDVLLNYNFADNLVSGAKVTDAAEKHFTGTLMKNAMASTIGPDDNKQRVLKLYSDSAYFDMGVDCGKLIYLLDSAYSISMYFLIDPTKTNFSNKGNFLYTFSNSDSSNLHKTGFMFGRATNAMNAISSQDTVTGNMQTAAIKTEPSKDVFHSFVFTQNGSVGTTYLDGDTVSSVRSFTNIPSIAIPKDGLFGTLYNWLGRSNYPGQAFLANAMIADFKLQKKVLSSSDLKEMNTKASLLNAAHRNLTPVEVVKAADKCRLDVSIPGLLQIIPVGNEKVKVTVYDPLGRIVAQTDSRTVYLLSGIYIVRINNNQVEKVWIK